MVNKSLISTNRVIRTRNAAKKIGGPCMRERRTNSRRLQLIVREAKKPNPVSRVGETENFVVDYDSDEKLVLLYPKEMPLGYSFKLGLNKTESKSIVNLLVKAQLSFRRQ
jgi:hypothetical protein